MVGCHMGLEQVDWKIDKAAAVLAGLKHHLLLNLKTENPRWNYV